MAEQKRSGQIKSGGDGWDDDDWGPSSAETSDEMPDSTADPNRLTFIKPFHLSAREGTFEMVAASGATRYSDVVLHIKVGSKVMGLGLKTFDPAYVALKKRFGPKRADWHGTLKYRVMPHNGKPDGFVAVRPA